MEAKTLTEIKFGSFVKLHALVYFSLGFILGILAFILSLMGADVTATFGTLQLSGVKAGVVNIILFPAVFYLFGAMLGLIIYWPFKLFLKLFKGLKMEMTWE